MYRKSYREEMDLVELLAPAGSREALIAAVESGANAVYLAGNRFSARAYANNFDEDGLREAIRFAHLRGVLIHVTVNTIVSDEEIPALKDYLRFLYEAGADAVLVQDLGAARIAREIVPGMPLHASTQMTVHSLAGVLALQQLGFARVVLSRELSLQEIRHICTNCDVEIEVFMHGALCVCYSGQCLMSSLIGGRSGNRGRCAQPCRLPYTLVNEAGEDVLGDRAGNYLLSPKDLNTIDLIPALIDAGVSSLKIEGRMKRPEYVATVVGTYRKAVDACCAGEAYEVSQQDRNKLAQIFNRDFTTAYLLKCPGREMMSDRRPNNRGLLIGRVCGYDWNRRIVTVKLTGQLTAGDQVDFWVKVGGRVTATIQELADARGSRIETGMAGDTVSFAIPSAVREHDRVFKVYDAALMEAGKEMYASGAPVRRIPITACVKAAVGQPLTILLDDGHGHKVTAATEFIGEAARKRPLTEDVVRKQVERLGTSVYELVYLKTVIDGNVMIPMSEINEARRKAVELLDAQRLAEFRLAPRVFAPLHERRHVPSRTASLMVSADTVGKVKAAIEAGADGILFGGESYAHKAIPWRDYQEAWELAKASGVRIDFNLPRIIRENHQKPIENLLADWNESCRPDAVHVHNIGAFALAKQRTDLPIHADYSLISYNKQTLAFLRDYGAAEATLSPELNLRQIQSIAKGSALPLTCIVHGRLELMISEYCVTGSFLGETGEGICTQPCLKGSYALKDRKEALFPLVMDQYCHMHVLNSKSLSMLPHAMKFAPLGIQTLRIEAKSMTEAEIRQIVKAYRKAAKLPAELDEAQEAWIKEQEGGEITRGHYFRGVL